MNAIPYNREWQGEVGSMFHPTVRPTRDEKGPGNYTDNPDQYIQAFITIIQTYDLAWKDGMLLLYQTLTSLEKQQVLAQATQMGDDFYLQWALMPQAPGNK
jgi:hypothetical protein